jgi:hypothetical protein
MNCAYGTVGTWFTNGIDRAAAKTITATALELLMLCHCGTNKMRGHVVMSQSLGLVIVVSKYPSASTLLLYRAFRTCHSYYVFHDAKYSPLFEHITACYTISEALRILP